MIREEAWRKAKGCLYDVLSGEEADEIIKALERESCDDCISRQAVLDYIYNDLGLGDEENGKDVERQMELENSYKYVKFLPPVTPTEKMGKWLTTCLSNIAYCSECDNLFKNISTSIVKQFKYCPDCGAKMEEVKE